MARCRNSEDRHNWVPDGGQRKLGQIQHGSFAEVGNSLFYGFALGGRSSLRIERDKAALLGGRQYSSEFHEFAPVPDSLDYRSAPP